MRIYRRWLSCFVALFAYSAMSFSQTDTEFWFAAPSVTEGHGDRPIFLRFTALDKPARVVISQPAEPRFDPIVFIIDPHQSESIDLTDRINLIENIPFFRVLNKGIHIKSDRPVTVFYEVNHRVNPDIFTLKGRNALGNEFVIPAQNFWSKETVFRPKALSTADIVATENNTRITVIPSVETQGHPAGESIEVVLDRGQTYSVVSLDQQSANALTGTRVLADRPIAITIKDDSNKFGSCFDLGGDQLVPTALLGTEYIAVRGFLQGGDRVFVQAIANETILTIDGNEGDQRILNAGEMFDFLLQNRTAHIRSSKPVYVLHASGFGCEVGMALLPKIICTGSKSVSFSRSTQEEFGMILITRKGNENHFILNGDSTLISTSDFIPVVGSDSQYVAAQINLTDRVQGLFAFLLSNDAGSFHLGTITGGPRTGCRYGYFSDFKTLKILTEVSKICEGDDLILQASGADTYVWSGDALVEGLNDEEVTVSPSVHTVYSVVGSDGFDGCIDTAFFNVEVFAWPEPEVFISQTCIDQDIIFTYTGEEELTSVKWAIGQDTFFTDWHDTLLLNWSVPGPQTIGLKATNPAGCAVDTIYHIEVGGVRFLLDSVSTITNGDHLEMDFQSLDHVPSTVYQWAPMEGLSCFDCINPIFSPSRETTYQLSISDSLGCVSTYNTHVYVDSPIFVPNAFTPNGDGVNDFLQVFAPDITVGSLKIFDRWGQKIFEGQSGDPKWDGSVGNKQADPGTYLYLVKGIHNRSKNFIEKSGSFYLIR